MKKYTLLIIMVLAGITGYLYINKPTDKEFGALINLAINQSASFKDGLNITLLEINDSRCPKNVVCIWEGELSALFKLTGGSIGNNSKEIRLGTSRIKSDSQFGYTITLESATEKTAIIKITK